ncbi:Transforming growth factor-beta-induced protein ig-h3 [Temnothorax longispinosus]|uniref:Transforming growth factor-beta-induced protein ig-h3 n=1 Tax=Temnothorax longispinosus TaxID=300112 RepID=A0A4S2KLE0_9HYME|nr:Transforming growth factor-beta-induced protein ig-h3 [Temnothorax longispinosus]
MRQRYFLCFLWTALTLRGDILVAAEADPAILNGADLPHLQQIDPFSGYDDRTLEAQDRKTIQRLHESRTARVLTH